MFYKSCNDALLLDVSSGLLQVSFHTNTFITDFLPLFASLPNRSHSHTEIDTLLLDPLNHDGDVISITSTNIKVPIKLQIIR